MGQLIDFSSAVEDPSTGLKCVLEEATVDTFEKERLLTCTHSMIQVLHLRASLYHVSTLTFFSPQVCHYTYVTQFRPHRVEECSEYYEKTCSIVFSEKATNETVRKCYKPVEKVCNGQGPEECRTVYESSCTTKYVEKQPGKFVGDTGCERLPVEICGAGCTFEEGEEECHEKTISASITVPEEACDLQPQEKCQGVYKLVPFLSPSQECKQVPREVCTFGVLKGEPGEKPITTKWCYDPEAETDLLASGLSEDEDSAPSPPRDPFLPPTDSFQFPQQTLDPLDLDLDYPESEDDSLSLPTYTGGYQGRQGRERDNLFYIPPAPELSQALEEEDRAGRKVKERKKQKTPLSIQRVFEQKKHTGINHACLAGVQIPTPCSPTTPTIRAMG